VAREGSYYPVCLNVINKSCLIVGGGKVAERKVLSLLDAGGLIKVVSPKVTSELARLAEQGKVSWIKREYRKSDLKQVYLVIAATDKKRLNCQISQDARRKGVLVNVVDEPELSDFITPAVVKRGKLIISVSTSGTCPALARWIKQELEEKYSIAYGKLLEILEKARLKIKASSVEENQRQQLIDKLINAETIRLAKLEKYQELERRVSSCIS
jgi:siroheme synthase-like protein